MQTLIFTGNGSEGIALSAAATASYAAQCGQRTLLGSIIPSHSLGALLEEEITDTPRSVAPNLDAWTFDVLKWMGNYLEDVRPRLFGVLAQLSAEELPLIPGLEFFLGLDRLIRESEGKYDLVVVDAGDHDALLRALAVPDGFRWFMRLVFGLDRGPGQSMESMSRAIIPSNLLPFQWPGQIQDTRVLLEKLRDDVVNVSHTTARYVLRPDIAGLHKAQLALPALQLHSLAVDSLINGPMLPADTPDTRLASIAADQQEIVAEAERIWSPRPMFRLPISGKVRGAAALAELGQTLYNGGSPTETHGVKPPIEQDNGAEPSISIRLPGLKREALSLALGYDELIIGAGPYRRHLLLPQTLRGTNQIKASREGEQLIVRLRRE